MTEDMVQKFIKEINAIQALEGLTNDTQDMDMIAQVLRGQKTAEAFAKEILSIYAA